LIPSYFILILFEKLVGLSKKSILMLNFRPEKLIKSQLSNQKSQLYSRKKIRHVN